MGRRSRSSLCGCLQLLCIGFAVAIVRCDFAVGPSNQAVVAGRRMEMECRATNSSGLFKWAVTRIASDKKQPIFRVNRRPNNSAWFSAAKNFGYFVDEDGSGIIFKNSTNPEDAGIYFCYDYPGQMQFSAHLIVFESEPLCHVNYTSRGTVAENATMAPMATKGEEVSMSCRVNYRGLWRPSVEWRRHTADGDGGKVVARDASMDAISSESVSSSLDILIDFDLTTYFSFRLFFIWPKDLIPVNASNVPEYSYEWRSPELVRERPKIEPVVQVIVETVTSEDKPTGDWYLVSLVLLVVVPVIVFSIVVRRCYISYRRTKGLDQRPTPAKSSFLDGLERPASGEYDVIPYAAPNIYDRIDDEEANERGTETQQQQQQKQQQQQQKQHPPLTQCYSHLSEVALLPPSNPYDALTPYLSMESAPNSPGLCPLPEIPLTERCQNRYTEVARRGNSMAPTTTTTKDNYLTLVGEGEAAASASDNDNEDSSSSSFEEDASVSVNRFAKASGDYLIPFV